MDLVCTMRDTIRTAMSALLNTIAFRALSALPPRVLRQIELASGAALGKGWGSGTVNQETQAVLNLLPPEARRSPVVFDVGANVGAWTAAFLTSAPDAEVYSFEPSAAAFGELAKRFADDDRVHAVNAAAGDEVGQVEMWSDAPGSSLGSLSRRRLDHFGIEFSHSEVVPVVKLESWCSEMAVQPVVLKLDVEGHELAVLRGAGDILMSLKVVQFEFGGCNIDSRTYFQDFFYFFREAGFGLYRLGPKGLEHLERYSELEEAFRTTNYFAQRL